MNISKISVVVEIEGTPCMVLLSDMDEQKRTLLAQIISAFCKEHGTLQVAKLKGDISFETLTKDDFV